MILVIDIGNSVVHFGVYHEGMITERLFLSHDSLTEENVQKWLAGLPETIQFDHVVVCSVCKPVEEVVVRLFARYDLFHVHSDLDLGFSIPYALQSTFGADRFANIVAFRARYQSPGVVIDIGSALTVDMLDENGDYYGGMIFPGPGLSSRILHDATDKLPAVTVRVPQKKWGNSTEESIQCGIYSAYKGLIPHFLLEARKEFGFSQFFTVACGGWCSIWKNEWKFIDIIDPDHTLKGIGDTYFLAKK